MEIKINAAILALVKGDITNETTDCIVNAANSRLAGGGGVDGAIHGKGGPEIMKELKNFRGCPTGGAVITGAGRLKARYVIHAVGPVYRDGKSGEEALLKGAYEESLKIALQRNLKSIAFPSISTGAYGYPVEKASMVALKAVRDFLKRHKGFETVRFVLFGDSDLEVYENALKKILAG